MKLFERKPERYVGVQWNGENFGDVVTFLSMDEYKIENGRLVIMTRDNGAFYTSPGQWIFWAHETGPRVLTEETVKEQFNFMQDILRGPLPC